MIIKRILPALLAALMLLSATACSGDPAPASSDTGATTTTEAGDEATTTEDISATTTEGEGTPSDDVTTTTVEGQTTSAGQTTTTQKPGDGKTTQKPENGKTTTTKKPTTTSTTQGPTTTRKPGGDGTITTGLIKTGTKAMDAGLDFGGKTFTMACGISPTSLMKRQVAAFGSKYNCKIEISNADYDAYNQLAANKKASGESYTILELEGHRFPDMVLINLVEELEDYFTTADLVDTKNLAKGGLSKDLTEQFTWNGHRYATAVTQGYYGTQPVFLWYNKALLKKYGFTGSKDPRTMYEKGNWDWDAMLELAQSLKKSGQYFGNRDIFHQKVPLTNGALYVTLPTESSPAKANLLDKKVVAAYEYARKFFVSNNECITAEGSQWDDFISGQIAFLSSAMYHYNTNANLAEQVIGATAFNKNLDNLGVVPYPVGPDNKDKAQPAAWLYGVAAGSGQDPRVAIAYNKFCSGFKDNTKEDYPLPDADQKLFDEVRNGKLLYFNASYTDGQKSQVGYIAEMEWQVVDPNQDPNEWLMTTNAILQNCIDVTLKG